MDAINIQHAIKQVLAEVKGDPTLVTKLTKDTNLINDTRLDSLQIIEFMLSIEERFNLEMDFEVFDFIHLSSLSRFTRFVTQQIDAQ
jgi:acyl carrier protein